MRRDHGAEAVLAFLQSQAGADHCAVVSVPAAMEASGLSERSVQRAIRRLRDAGRIEVEQRGGAHRCNRYHLLNGARTTAAERLLRPEKPRSQQGLRAEPRRDAAPSSRRPVVTTPSKGPTAPLRAEQSLEELWGPLTDSRHEQTAAPQVAMNGRRPPSAPASPPAARPASKRARPAPPNAELFAALSIAIHGEYAALTRSERGLLGRAAGEIAEVGGAPGDVAERWAACLERYDHPTAMALAAHWNELGRPAHRAQRQSAADQRRGEQAAELRRRLGVPT